VRVALEDRARHIQAACGGWPLSPLVVCVCARPLQDYGDRARGETLPSHRHRVCHSGVCPQRLRMPSDMHVPTCPTRCPCVH
jgi:hypothetical protein